MAVNTILTHEICGGAPLTKREREVLLQLALGRTTEEAGAAIFLSPHTVRCHVKNAMRKLGARTRPQAVAVALVTGSIVLDVVTAPHSAV